MSYANQLLGNAYADQLAMNGYKEPQRMTTGSNAVNVGMTGVIGDDQKLGHRAIPQAFDNLQKDVAALGELVNVLNNRLKPLSKPETPNIEEDRATADQVVPFVGAIAGTDRMLRLSLNTMQSMIERLEI